jgi:hypothetical protein
MAKLLIKAQHTSRGGWTVEQAGFVVYFSISFARACLMAAQWHREGWIYG